MSHGGASARLKSTDGDQGLEVFEGRLGGKRIVVRVWRGMSVAESSARVGEMQTEWEELAEASIAGATSEMGDSEVVEDFGSPSHDLGDLETIAIAVADGTGLVDYRSPSTAGEVVDSKGRAHDSCLRSAEGSSVVAESEMMGEFAFPTAAATVPNAIVRYRTFIKPAKVDDWVANLTCGIFKGDDRTYTTRFSAPSRTSVTLVFNWNTKSLVTIKTVGRTYKLDSSGKVIAEKTASPDGIKFYSPVVGSSTGRVQVNHAIANPLCTIAGPISYSVVVEVWKDGSARISGNIKKVPHHEAYVYPKSETNGKTIFRRASDSFFCLNLNCANESIWEVVG